MVGAGIFRFPGNYLARVFAKRAAQTFLSLELSLGLGSARKVAIFGFTATNLPQ